MNIDPYILAFSALTVIATIWMGFRSAKQSKTTSDFFVAGRSVGVGMNASAISGEYLSAASFMGIAGMVMSSGYDALWYPVCYACGYLFLLLFIAGPLRRFGAYTIPDFAEGRFDSPVFRKIAVVFVLFIGFFYTMPQMKGAGTTLAYIFPGLPYWAGVVLVGAVITLNVALGGMKGITLVQAFQYWAKMFAISVPIFVLMAVYGHYGKQVGVNAAAQKSALTRETFSPVTWKVTSINGNSNRWSLKVNEAKSAVSRMRGKPPSAFGDLEAFTVLRLLAEQHGLERLLIAQSAPQLGQLTNKIYVTTASTPENWERDVRSGLRSNGVELVVTSSALILVPTGKLADYEAQYQKEGMSAFEVDTVIARASLPAKAPADVTWLNPFGPLTTKAAKNAAAAIAKQSTHTGPDFILVSSPDQIARATSAALKSGTTNISSPLPANTLMNIDRALTRISEVFGVDAFRTADVPMTISGAASTNPLGYETGLAFVKRTLALSGVAVIEHGNSVYAVPSGRADFYKTRLESVQSPVPLRADLAPDQRLTVNLDSPSVAQVLAVYSDLTGRMLVPRTNAVVERVDDLLAGALSKWKLVSRTALPDSGVRIHGDGAFTAGEVKSAIEAQLRTNGLALVAVGEKAFAVQRAPGILPGPGSRATGEATIGNPETRQDAGEAFFPGEGRLQINPDQFPNDFQKESAEISFPTHAAELKNTAARWGLGNVSTTLPTPSCQTATALSLYTAFRRGLSKTFTNYVDRGILQSRILDLDTSKVIVPPVPMSARQFTEYIERVFRTNGLTLIHVNRDAVALVLTENITRFQPKTIAPSAYAVAADLNNMARPQNSSGAFAADVQKAWLDKHEKPLALLYTYSLIIAIVCGTAGLPHILVRFYTNPDGVAAKKTTMWVMILIGVFYLFPPIFGVMGRNLLPSLYAGSGAKGTDKVVLELPRILNRKAEGDGPRRNNGSEGKATPSSSGIPWGSILSGITCAGAFAAFMSTFSGLLVSMTGALAHDVYGRILRPKATPEQRMRMFRISAVLIGTVAVVLGSFVEPLQINFMVGQAFAIAAASYFPLLFMSVWWRGMTMKGAAAGMLTGGICALAAVTITNFSDLKWINLADFWAAHPLLRILCEQPAIWTVPLAIGLMIVVSKLTRREVPADSRMKMLVLHAPEELGLKQEYIQEHQAAPGH